MRFFTGMARKSLVGAAVGLMAGLCPMAGLFLAPAAAQVAVPAVALPAAFRNAPPELPSETPPEVPPKTPPGAPALAPRDPADPADLALGDADLARLIDAARRHSPAHAPLAARLRGLGRGSAAAIEKRWLEAELARLDQQVGEEVAHAWLDARAAVARAALAADMGGLAREMAALVRQRLDAGLAVQTELEQAGEQSHKISTLAERFAQERQVALTRLLSLTAEAVLPAAATQAPAPFTRPIRTAVPAVLQQRPDVRAARVHLESRAAGAAELQAGYREVLLRALDEAEAAYAAASTARGLRTAALPHAARAQRQAAALQEQLDAGRIGKAQWLEAQTAERRARLGVLDAEHAYARAWVTLERALGR